MNGINLFIARKIYKVLKEKPVKIFELWIEKSGYKFFESTNTTMLAGLESDAKMIWKTQATTWEEAQKKKAAFLGLSQTIEGHVIDFNNFSMTIRTDNITPIIDLIKSSYAVKH